METNFTVFFCFFGALFFLMVLFLTAGIRVVREDVRLSVYRLGRYMGDKGPGLVFLIPILDRGVLKQMGDMEKTPGMRLAGATGETRTTVFTDGKVFLAGEEWDAISQAPISTGQRVRVVRIILEVEKE
jgi:hypothetical protein